MNSRFICQYTRIGLMHQFSCKSMIDPVCNEIEMVGGLTGHA